MGSSCCKSSDANPYILHNPSYLSKTANLSFKDPMANSFEMQLAHEYNDKLNKERWVTLRDAQKLPQPVLNCFGKKISKLTITPNSNFQCGNTNVNLGKSMENDDIMKLEFSSNNFLATNYFAENSLTNTKNISEIYENSISREKMMDHPKRYYKNQTQEMLPKSGNKHFKSLKNGNLIPQSLKITANSVEREYNSASLFGKTKGNESSNNNTLEMITESKFLV